MRVAMLCWEFPPSVVGGMGVVCDRLVRALDRLGHEVLVVAPRHLGADLTGTRRARWVPLDVAGDPGVYRPSATAPEERSARFRDAVADAMAGARFDIVHAHDWLTLEAGSALAQATSRPLVAHVHSTEPERACGPGDPRIRDLESRRLKSADAVIAVSRVTARVCERALGVPTCHVVHNAVDRRFAVPAADRVGRDARTRGRPPAVLFAGRLTRQKGPDLFLDLVERLALRGAAARFIVAGDGELSGALHARANETGVEHLVEFVGFQDGVAMEDLYDQAWCLVAPSRAEPFGLVPLEASIRGVPALVCRQAGVCEVVPSLATIDVDDLEPAADLLWDILTMPSLARCLSVRAIREAQRRTWDDGARACLAVYARALRRSS